jgi:glycosidase
MTNFDFESLEEVNDVESRGLNRLMKKMHIPGFLRWKWIKASSRDNARTPMQWNDGKNAGFSQAKPWLGVNANYKYINYESQKNDPLSVLNFYKALIALRQKSDCLKYGEFAPLLIGDREVLDDHLMFYQRKLGDEVYTVALNFSSRKRKLKRKLPKEIVLQSRLIISNTGRVELNDYLLPWEGVLLFSETAETAKAATF